MMVDDVSDNTIRYCREWNRSSIEGREECMEPFRHSRRRKRNPATSHDGNEDTIIPDNCQENSCCLHTKRTAASASLGSLRIIEDKALPVQPIAEVEYRA